jgi:hypothetical protein
VRGLTEAEFMALPRGERATLVRAQETNRRGAVPSVRRWADLVDARGQADGHRFVWWPSLVTNDVLARQLPRHGLVSRHREVKHWPAELRGVRAIAGTFPSVGGANCFANAMAAFGDATGDEWTAREPFEDWLRDRFRPGGHDDDPATVLVWREDGLVAHSAVTLGDGWAFEKPSCEWYTARTVASVADIKRKNRVRGWHLERHRLR